MITQYQVPSLLKEELPYLESKTYPSHIILDIYRSIHDFAEYTRKAIQEHHLLIVKKCFNLAEKLYNQGDKVVRMCIENIFIYFFTTFMPNDRIERIILQSFIPDDLNEVYVKQVSACSC
jgi:hypothetical protein